MQSSILWTLSKSLWTLNVLANALVVWRLFSSGLHRTYRFFCAYVLIMLARSAALYPFLPRSEAYYRIWMLTQPLLWICYVLVVTELFSLVLKHYRGIYSLGRWFFFTAVSVSVIISALTVMPTVAGGQGKHPILYYYMVVERGVVTSLAIFLLLLLVLVAWFPVPLSRNLLMHSCVYSTYFFVNNVIVLYWQVGEGSRYTSTLARLGFALACQFCWIFFLSREGEARFASLHLGRSPLSEKKLLGQLETLNETLLRTVRK